MVIAITGIRRVCFKELFLEYFEQVKAEAETGELKFTDLDYYKDKIESGKAAEVLNLNPLNGDLNYQEVIDLIQLLEKYDLSLRTTNRQGLLLRGVDSSQLEALKEDLAAVNQSRDLLPQIYISGCPNSCGQHHIGKIGFEGKAKRENGRLIPYYSLLLGAEVSEENTQYAQKTVDLPAKRIPSFLVELAEKLAAAEDYSLERFNDYLETGGREAIIQLAQKYTEIPAYSKEADFYQDWGQNEDFSLAGRGPGECGTGVLEIVRLDLDQAEAAYEQGIAEEDSDSLYQAIIAAARSLLIVRGVDTEKDRVIIKEFKKKFIAEDWVAESKEELLEQALDYRLGDQEELLSLSSEIKDLIERLEDLFNSLNSSLEFTIKKVTAVEDAGDNDSAATDFVSKNSENDKAAAAEKENYKLKDLRGVQCPINFVKAKLFLEPLPAGEIVDFYLDEGEPIKNVPRSLENEDHEIIKNEKQPEGHYLLRVKKAAAN
jgi:sulfite reductase (ferredoxin)